MSYYETKKADQDEKKRVMDIRKEQITKDLYNELSDQGHVTTIDLKKVDGVLIGYELVYEYEDTYINRYVTGNLRMRLQDYNYNRRSFKEPKKGFILKTSIERILKVVEESKKRSREILKKQARKEKETNFFLDCCKKVEIKTSEYTTNDSRTYIDGMQVNVKAFSDDKVEINLKVTQDQLINIFKILNIQLNEKESR